MRAQLLMMLRKSNIVYLFEKWEIELLVNSFFLLNEQGFVNTLEKSDEFGGGVCLMITFDCVGHHCLEGFTEILVHCVVRIERHYLIECKGKLLINLPLHIF